MVMWKRDAIADTQYTDRKQDGIDKLLSQWNKLIIFEEDSVKK